jgi:putative inorganic carbon (hco3(-)) transporter
MMNLAYAGMAILAVATAMGTYERSAIVGMVVMGLYMFIRSRRKVVFGAFLTLAFCAIVFMAAKSWDARVSSIGEYNSDGSAMTRLLMWQWTLGYASTHPFGGGFDAYGISTIMMPSDPNTPGGYIQNGRAYHSIYFEMLGDLGWPGLFMFLTAAGSSMFSLLRLSRKCRKIADLEWVADLSDALQAGMLVFLTSGAFVGIACQPPFWYFVAMGVSLRAYVWHAERAEVGEAKGWRLVAQRTREAMVNRSVGWQQPGNLPSMDPIKSPVWRGGTRRS